MGSFNGTLTNGPTWVTPGFPVDTAPAAPSGLTATSGDHQVALTWIANGESDLAGYNVYRSTSTPVTKSSEKLNGTALVTSPAYTDTTGTVGTPYHYAVSAVDAAGNESDLSGEATGTPATTPQTISFGPLADKVLADSTALTA